MKRLYLHCGHGRTGTTSLQNLFEKNIKTMAQNNVIYPYSDALSQQLITSGNYQLFNKFDFSTVKENQAVLFSRETMWKDFLKKNFISKLEKLEDRGFKIHVLALERDFLSFADSWLKQMSKSISHLNSDKSIYKYNFLIKFKNSFEEFKSIVLARGWSKTIYSFDDWIADPDQVFFDAFEFHLPGPLANFNQSPGSIQNTMIGWIDTRISEELRKRSKWEQKALKVPVRTSIDTKFLKKAETDYLLKIADLQGRDIQNLQTLSQKRVDKAVHELQEIDTVDILAVRLIEECIHRSNLTAALGLIEIVRWRAESSAMLFEMLDERSCYAPLEQILDCAYLNKDSLPAKIWLGIAYWRIKKDYRTAADYFEGAIQLRRTPILAARIYQCYFMLGDAQKLKLAYQNHIDLISDEITRLFWKGQLADIQNDTVQVEKIIEQLQNSGGERPNIKTWINSYREKSEIND